MSDLLTAKELLNRIKENDNRCTASPYLLLLQEKEFHIIEDGYGNDVETKYIENITGDYCQFDSIGELKDFINDGLEDDEKYGELIEDEHYRKHSVGYSWVTKNVFLTDKGYQDHLDQNRHNLENYRSFGIHAFRNNEIKSLLNVLSDNYNLQQENDKLRKCVKGLVKYG